MELQPLLHDLLVAVHAPTQAWSDADGQIGLADGRGARASTTATCGCCPAPG
jgi:hypothetical protein